jgi:surfactin synthase thioesterase subunit
MSVHFVAFPFAGGNKYTLNPIRSALPRDYIYNSPEVGGRGRRLSESTPGSLEEMLADLEKQVMPLTDHPYIFFGHCMGGLMAYELTRRIITNGGTAPAHVIICSCPAPSRISYNRLSAADLNESISLLRLFGLHEDLLNNESFVGMLQPVLYADINNYNMYNYSLQPKLDVSFTIITEASGYVAETDILPWQEETTKPLHVFQMNGPLLSHIHELRNLLVSLEIP